MGAQCICGTSETSELLVESRDGDPSDKAKATTSKSQAKPGPDRPTQAVVDHFDEEYQLQDGSDGILGTSSIGTVVKTKHKSTSKVHAVKQINKKNIEGEEWKEEIKSMKTLDHPNICKVHDTWEDAMNIYLVMEFCKGGQLASLSGPEAGDKVNESTVAVLVRQMVDAVSHLHQHNVVHSDIRPENWLFEEKIEEDKRPLDTQLKMVDFGFANKYGKSRSSSSRFPTMGQGVQARSKPGWEERTLFCKAPEQVGTGNTVGQISGYAGKAADVEKADVWALGIIAYFLLSGQPPFTGPPEKDTLFRTGNFVFMPADLWRPVSSEAKNFIAMCLQEFPSDRPRADKVLSLPWMGLAQRALSEEADLKKIGRWPPTGNVKSSVKLSLLDPPLPSAERLKSSFARMNQLNVLEKAAVIAAAHKLQEQKIGDLAKVYETMDKNKEGVITAQEFFDGLESCGVPCKELALLIKGIDMNGSRMIEYPEFIAAIEDFQRNMQDSAVWSVFRNFDAQGNQAVMKKKLVEAMGRQTHRKQIANNFPELPLESVLEDLDHDGNGVIEFEEFKQILRQSGRSVASNTSSKPEDKVVM